MIASPLALGCMRLSTERDRDEARATAVLHAALDAGVTLLDTADVYCLDDNDIGHNERLIARALRSWKGDRSTVSVATKGGLTRPEGRWEPDGRARHLAAACERSCRALDVAAIDLYQLHAVDPRTPLATSMRALAGLQKGGLIKSIGLSNVTVRQIEDARRIAPVYSVQAELSVLHDDNILGGVVEYCIAHGIQFLAYRPLGGRKGLARIAADPALKAAAARHHASPHEIALAWLKNLHHSVIPLPGATRVETVRSAAHAQRITLDEDDRRLLDATFSSARMLRPSPSNAESRPLRADSAIVMVMGLPAAGKTTLIQSLVESGYRRLNRDEAGGSLGGLIAPLERALADGPARIVLDNTYATRKARAAVVRAAAGLGVSVHCKWLTTGIDDAQVNAATRLVDKYGFLPDDRQLKAPRRKDVNAFPPTVLFRYQRELEPPQPSEGFESIEQVPFARRADTTLVNRALMIWCDRPEELTGSADAMRRYALDGWTVIVLSWQPAIAEGTASAAVVDERFVAAQAATGVEFDFAYCPHGAGPPRCWCRKPLPGLGVVMMRRHRIDAARSIFVGSGPQDANFARKLGLPLRLRLDDAL